MKRLTALLLTAVLLLTAACALAEDYSYGDRVYFGRYEQDNNKKNGPESICWIVIGKEGGDLVLLSEKALANRPFNTKSNGTTWGDSSLRKWLNKDFINEAFTAEEADAIRVTKVQDNAEHSYSEWNTNDRFSGITEDKLFCMSYLEVSRLLTRAIAACEPTAVTAKSKNKILLEDKKYCYWWLRTSSMKNNAMMIAGDKLSTAYEHQHQICVRPAMVVDASAVTR